MTTLGLLLTGGASRRMGRDKANIEIDGVPLSHRLLEALIDQGYPVAAFGHTLAISMGDRLADVNIPTYSDPEEYAGPLSALSHFRPYTDTVFVLACDLPRFDARLVYTLRHRIGDSDAAVPVVGGYRQPLAALYHARAFEQIGPVLAQGRHSLMAWLDRLDVVEVYEDQLGVAPNTLQGANTPEELEAILQEMEHS